MEDHHKNGVEERRRHTRFPVKEWRLIAALGPKPFTVGKIVDISRVGVSVEFLPILGEKEASPTEIDIYLIGRNLHIQGLKCRCVYTEEANRPDFSMISTKRCGIAFQTLEETQLSQFEPFLNSHNILDNQRFLCKENTSTIA